MGHTDAPCDVNPPLPGPVEPWRDPSAPGAADGVDETLIRWMLRKTPEERLAALREAIVAIDRMRRESR